MEQMPPMDMQPDMGNDMGGGFMPQDDIQQAPVDGGMGQTPNEYGADFDAGVEADEEQDPKKFIQQLTGKLSQSLQKYNDNNGQPDIDLNKYVAGMIIKQSMKGLSEEDAEEIISKVKSDEDFSTDDNQENGDNTQMMDGGDDEMPDNDQTMNENFLKEKINQQIKEIVNGVLDKDEEDMPQQKPKNRGRYSTSAYTSPNFQNK
jgi:hypothetical protein